MNDFLTWHEPVQVRVRVHTRVSHYVCALLLALVCGGGRGGQVLMHKPCVCAYVIV